MVTERGSAAMRKDRGCPKLHKLVNLCTTHLVVTIQKIGNFELQTVLVREPIIDSERGGCN